MRSTVAISLAMTLLAPLPTLGDEITDQIDQAKTYYGQGDVPGAIAELEFALQALRGKISQELLATFPPAPAGWTMIDAGDQQPGQLPMMGSGAMLSRTYRQDGGDASIEAQLMTGGGFLQGIAGMFLNPQVMAAQPGAKRVRIGRENAVATYDASNRSSQLVLDLGGKATLMLQGHNVAGSEPLIELASKWDLAKVKALVGG